MMILLTAMLLVFTVIYFIVTAKKGFAYENTLLIPEEAAGGIRYGGTVGGKAVSFFVSADKTVEFSCGGKVYGPYVLKEDLSAVPEVSGSQIALFRENGEPETGIRASSPDGVITLQNGTVIDAKEPSAVTVISLMEGPVLSTQGSWMGWLAGTLLCVSTAFHVFFADDLFRWRLHLQARNAEGAEPSDWVVVVRAVGWVVMTVVAVIAYVMGLKTIPPV